MFVQLPGVSLPGLPSRCLMLRSGYAPVPERVGNDVVVQAHAVEHAGTVAAVRECTELVAALHATG